MALVDARGFNLNPRRDISPLTDALTGLFDRKREEDKAQKLQKAQAAQQQLDTTGVQFLDLAGLSSKAKTPEERRSALKEQRKALAQLGQAAAARGEDISVYEDAQLITNSDDMHALLMQVARKAASTSKIVRDKIFTQEFTEGGTDQNKFQFGGQEIFKDEDGNLFFGTTSRDPQTAGVDPILTPIGHNNPAKGKLSPVSTAGLTPTEKVAQAKEIEENKSGIEIKTEKQKVEDKLTLEGTFKPKIEAAITEARSIATERGEAFTDLIRMRAALPGLLEATNELKELAQIATSTIGGKIWDFAVKETGFGATKGSTAKAKFIAIVNNQVLPLLKPTFGGSFSVQEGESLKATMGDPDATPEEKMVQLNAFIEAKIRIVETKQRQLDEQPTQVLKFDAQGNPL